MNMKKIEYNSIGIYAIINIINKKLYIGSSSNLRERILSHIRLLKQNKHENNYLQNSYNKYGLENFKIEILEYTSLDELLLKEQYYIDLNKSYLKNNGYNINPIAKNPPSRMGYKMSEETKNKIKEANTGQKRNKKIKDKMRIAKLNKDNFSVSKKCINIDTGILFNRVKDASKFYNISYGNLCQACKGKRKKAGGFRWKYLDKNEEL